MELILLNLETNERFNKYFETPYLAQKFKNKIKYSKKIRLVGEFNAF